jgi:multidrug transporter EmrE-like cation transporter
MSMEAGNCLYLTAQMLRKLILGEQFAIGAFFSLALSQLGAIVYAGGMSGAVQGVKSSEGLVLIANALLVTVYNIAVRAAARRHTQLASSSTNVPSFGITLSLSNNLLSLVPLTTLALYRNGGWASLDSASLSLLALSALLGCVISVIGLSLREKVTATAFTLMTNLGKLGTIVIAMMLRSEPLSPHQLLGLILSVFAGAGYSLYSQRR